jgi:hypothetical protein
MFFLGCVAAFDAGMLMPESETISLQFSLIILSGIVFITSGNRKFPL